MKGQIVTIDAMGTQKEIAEKIRNKRADYVLAVKGNQGNLYEDLKLYFSDEGIQKEIEEKKSYSSSLEKAHGQIEKREYYQTDDKQAAQNLNIIRKWSLGILKMVEIMKPGLSIERSDLQSVLSQSSI